MKTLREMRLAKGVGLRQCAELVGLLPSRLCAIENGAAPDDQERQRLIVYHQTAAWVDPPPKPDEGEVIPVFVRTVSGHTITPAEAEGLADHLNTHRRRRAAEFTAIQCPGCEENTMHRQRGGVWVCNQCGYQETR